MGHDSWHVAEIFGSGQMGGYRNIEVMSYGQSRKKVMSNDHSNDNFLKTA